jgi:hypothetical protein
MCLTVNLFLLEDYFRRCFTTISSFKLTVQLKHGRENRVVEKEYIKSLMIPRTLVSNK